MARYARTLLQRKARAVAASATAPSPRTAALAIVIAGAGFLWLIAAAPPLLSVAFTVALAAAWCRWLEQHPSMTRR